MHQLQPPQGLRHRRRLVRHRRRQGAPRARHPLRLLREVRPRSAATGSSATATGCRRPTARCTSTRRASAWSTRTTRCRSRIPDFPHHTQIAAVLRRLRRPLRLPRPDPLRDRRRARGAPRRRRLGGRARRAARRERYDARAGRQRPPLGPALARAARSPARRSTASRCTPTTTSTPTSSADKRVVVLGMGNSAMDIAVDASYVGRRDVPRRPARRAGHPQVHLRPAAGPAVAPRHLAGVPIRLPFKVRQKLLEQTLLSRRRRHGALRAAQARPQVRRGAPDDLRPHPRPPRPRRDHAQAEHRRAARATASRFTDGTEVEADVVVYCTGYKVTFPFFDEDFISAPDNDLPLFRRVFHPDIETCSSSALLQPLGAIMPLAEAQGAVARRLPARRVRAAGAAGAARGHPQASARRCSSAT